MAGLLSSCKNNTHLSVSDSPVYFAGLVPTSILPIRSVVSMLALEVNKGKKEEKHVKGEW